MAHSSSTGNAQSGGGGRDNNPAKLPLQLPLIIMEVVHTNSPKRTHPRVSDFLLTHCLERDKLSKNHKEPFYEIN
jgi:hypothetical protein